MFAYWLRYETDRKLMDLLKLCSFLDPRLQSTTDEIVQHVIVQAVALGKDDQLITLLVTIIIIIRSFIKCMSK